MSVVRDVLRATGAGSARELVALHATVSRQLPVRRRIGVAALAGGSGCSTVATELALVLGARRTDAMLLVSAQGASPMPLSTLDGQVATCVLPDEAWPAGVGAWWSSAGDVHRGHDLTITDWGAIPADRIRDVAEHSHVLCVAAAAERDAVQRALDVVVALGDRTPVVLVVTDVHRTAGAATAALVGSASVPAVLLPHDRRRPASVSLPTRQRGDGGVRMVRLAAAVVDALGHDARSARA